MHNVLVHYYSQSSLPDSIGNSMNICGEKGRKGGGEGRRRRDGRKEGQKKGREERNKKWKEENYLAFHLMYRSTKDMLLLLLLKK